MPLAVQQTAVVSVVLAIGVTVIAIALALRQWHERRHREADLSAQDRSHFVRQDIRRWMGTVVMVLLAIGLALGVRLEPKVAGRADPRFIQLWLGIILLIFILLCLALLDWVATHLYARRHRRAIVKERMEMLREELRRRSGPGHERDGPGDPIGDAPPS